MLRPCRNMNMSEIFCAFKLGKLAIASGFIEYIPMECIASK